MFEFLEEEQFTSYLSLAIPDHGDEESDDEDDDTKLPPDDGG